MTAGRIEIHLPGRDTPSECHGTYHSLMTAFGLELGLRYDKHFNERVGPDWFDLLVDVRRRQPKGSVPVNKFDPSFVVGEPLYHSDSPVRDCLPHGREFYDLLKEFIDTRNAWQHYNVEPTLDAVEDAAVIIHQIATRATMEIEAPTDAVLERIADLRRGGPLDEVAPKPGQRTEPAGLDLDASSEVVDEALRTEIRTTERREPRPPVGHPWTGSIPTRRVRLTAMSDLVDLATGESLRDSLGDRADRVTKEWHLLRPKGDLRVADDGATVGYVKGMPVLLGYLGPEPAPDPDAPSGFLVPQRYVVHDGIVVDRRSGESLADVATSDVTDLIATLSSVLPEGGFVRITTAGDIVRMTNAGATKLVSTTAECWFPGHISS